MIQGSGVALLVGVHTGATLAMVGLIWFVQVVHYPLFARVGADGFREYEAAHQRRTTAVVGPLMLAEAVTAVLMIVVTVPGVQGWLTSTGLGLLVVAWLSTALIQVPLHRRLERGFDADASGRLVLTNWIRTAAWTARGVVALWISLAAEVGGSA